MSKYSVDPAEAYNQSVEINRRARERYIYDLNTYGASTQAAILKSSTGLNNINNFLNDRFAKPLPDSVQAGYQDYIRSAQASRGFGGSGTGTTGEEARFLFTAAEASRNNLLPQYQQFSQGLLGMAGLQGPQSVSQQDLFQQQMANNEISLKNAMFSHQKTMDYVNTGVNLVGTVTGLGLGIGGLLKSMNKGGVTPQEQATLTQPEYQMPNYGLGGGSYFGSSPMTGGLIPRKYSGLDPLLE